jgi:hypothetical protein
MSCECRLDLHINHCGKKTSQVFWFPNREIAGAFLRDCERHYGEKNIT